MKDNEKIIQTFALLALGAAFVSLEKVSWAMNIFLGPAIAFTFTGAMIFLIHEKHIINVFVSVYKEGLKAGIVSMILFFSVYLTIHVLSSLAGFVILLSSYGAYKILKKKTDYYFLILSILSLAAIYFIPSYNGKLIVKILVIVSAFLGETALMFMLKEVKPLFNEKPKEMYFFANTLIALVSVALFFLTKSDTAAILSKPEQMHLFILTFISTFLISSVLIMKPKSAGASRITVIASAAVVSVILSFFAFSFFFAGGVILAAAPLLRFKKANRGFAITEFIAVLTLIAIVMSLLFPVYKKVRSEIIVRNDKKLFLSSQENKIEDKVRYGAYMIKYIDSQPKYLYFAKADTFKFFTIE